MTVTYSSYSPYYNTDLNASKTALGMFSPRTVPAEADDVSFEITATYHTRPDLLAYDLYSDARLWWVFAQRNPNTLVDPLGDFTTGTTIFLPKLANLKSALGL